MGERLVLSIEEVPAVAGKVNVRVEGERGEVRVEFGAVQEPRFFERFLKGRPATHVPWVMSRICGVCSVVHLTCSIEAVEKALGLEPKPEVRRLRETAKGVEILQNNLVHVLMSLPDFTGCGSVVEFSKTYPQLFQKLMSLNSAILEVSRRLCGRFIHMPSLGVGVHGKPISKHELEAASRTLREVSESLYGLAEDLGKVWGPLAEGFRDPSPFYCALKPSDASYPLFSDELLFSDGGCVKAIEYTDAIEERRAPYSNAHYTLYKGSPFYVGSRARLQAYAKLLTQRARELERVLRIDFSNPFDNVKAQYIEVAYLAEVLAEMLSDLASRIRGSVEPAALKGSPTGSG